SDAPLEDAIKAGLRHHPSFAEVDTATTRKMIPSFFPPDEDKAKALRLERCMRMLPQDQDTGGFFVSVMVKTGPILWQDLIAPGEDLAGDAGIDEASPPTAAAATESATPSTANASEPGKTPAQVTAAGGEKLTKATATTAAAAAAAAGTTTSATAADAAVDAPGS
ncbi:unnamed protein product, partial [Ectocarpus sp. 12 AP-2014]